MKTLIPFFALIFISINCYAQKNERFLLGKIKGENIEEYKTKLDEYDYWLDSTLQLQEITKSNYLIEVRLYQDPSILPTTGCTILYYDTAFHLREVTKIHPDWADKWRIRKENSFQNKNADSLAMQLVSYGIFSINSEQLDTLPPMEITNNKIALLNGICGGLDGTSYSLKIKIGDLFSQSYFHSSAQLHCDPSDQLLQRREKIMIAMRAGLRTERK